MPETAENLAAEFEILRNDQDEFALRSQQKNRKGHGKWASCRGNCAG
ncbi:MAG: hypothetical protein CM1200mP28_09610 [Deltaproteobacteria bacterium]|nr:MAG: hypothetical protein CM1200mP28_09610 [Deltaproteobacteria bacterium]